MAVSEPHRVRPGPANARYLQSAQRLRFVLSTTHLSRALRCGVLVRGSISLQRTGRSANSRTQWRLSVAPALPTPHDGDGGIARLHRLIRPWTAVAKRCALDD